MLVINVGNSLKVLLLCTQSNIYKIDCNYTLIETTIGHTKVARSYHTIKRMLKLYDELFGGYKITKKYFKLIERYNKDKISQDNQWSEFCWDCNITRTA